MIETTTYNKDCRFFTGYKPCRYKRSCENCPHYDQVKVRIAVLSLEAMGAVLRSTCLLEPILRKHPEAHITWITMPASAPLLANNPYIDRLITVQPQTIAALQFLEFDKLYAVDKSLEAGAIAMQIQATQKLGFGLDPKGVIEPLNPEARYQYDVGLDDELKFVRNQKPETQQLTESMDLNWQRDEYCLELTEAEKSESASFRASLPGDKVIGYNTGCSLLFPYKKFTVERSIELIREWRKSFPDACVALLGGREDTARQLAMKEAFSEDPYVVNTPTTLGLRKGIVLMNSADMVLSGCSLGMHIAIGLRKPVVAWFGVSCIQEVDLYDRGHKIQSQVTCSPCWKKSCDNEPKCFNQVPVAKIVDATRDTMGMN